MADPAGRDDVRLRPLGWADGPQLLAWRNSPAVAAHMFTDRLIDPEEHERWLSSALEASDRRDWIVELGGRPVGLSSLAGLEPFSTRPARRISPSSASYPGSAIAPRRRLGTGEAEAWPLGARPREADETAQGPSGPENAPGASTSRGDWGYYIADPISRGRGVGLRLQYLTLRHAFEALNLHKVRCEVLADNSASLGLCERFGFVREAAPRSHVNKGGEWREVIGLGLLARQWPAAKAAAEERLAARGHDPSRLSLQARSA